MDRVDLDGSPGLGRTLTVAVIDDHDVVHAGLEAWFAAADIEITAAGHTQKEAARIPAEVDAVVLDLLLEHTRPDLSVLGALCAAGHRVIVYSSLHEPSLVLACLEIGATTYLTKNEGRAHLVAAVQAAATDRPYIGPTMAGAMANPPPRSDPGLSAREIEVLLAWFRTESKQIVGQALHITPGTINTHLGRARTKYAAVGRPASTKSALLARAIQDGLISVDEL